LMLETMHLWGLLWVWGGYLIFVIPVGFEYLKKTIQNQRIIGFGYLKKSKK
jgi:hypothetical protein